ncbi:hybrid sensor histidine kinase/response regulator [Azospirillum canadense]|uniref:hybrid sensor histidine kinase/response regulator n=1 Tax=Azospirillum canadense TaxID=403962 RepID=UPI00222619AA|nr:ATP-binding protein [Azospirillum canadense]MCW2239213.1 PAS domain S-box-containing protein [Azospirillum canadense]
MTSDLRLSALAAAAGLPAVLFATVMLFLYSKERAAGVENGLRMKASAVATAVERQIANEFGVLHALATSEALDAPNLRSFQTQAQRVLEARSSWLGVVLTDHERQVMNTRIPGGMPLPPVADPGSLEQVFRTGKPQAGNLLVDTARMPEPIVTVRVPVFRNGEPRYALTAIIRTDALSKLLGEQGVPEGWRLAIVDRQGHLVASTASAGRTDPAISQRVTASVLKGAEDKNDDVFEAVSRDGAQLTVAVVRSDLTGWAIVAGTHSAAISALSRKPVAIAALGGLVAVALAGVLAFGQLRAYRRQRQAEQRFDALKMEQAVADRLTDITSNFPGMIYRRVLKDGVVSYPFVSECSRLYPDYEPGSIAGENLLRTLQHGMTPESRARWETAIRTSAETGEPYSVELEVIGRDGRTRWQRSLAHTRHEADGRVVWDGLVLDVTAEREAEAHSRISDERLRLAVAAADLGTFDLDLISRELTWSARCKAMFGLSADAAVTGAVYLSRVHPADVPLVRRAEEGAMDPASSGEYRLRFRALWPDGTVRWLDATGKVLWRDGQGRRQPVRLIGAVRDITEAQRAEQDIKDARDRAERANVSKSKFLAAASHDLRQPLQSLFLFAAALHGSVSGAKGREALIHLERGLDALKGLLDSLLDVSRFDAGVVQPILEDFALGTLIDQVAVEYAPIAEGKGLMLRAAPCADVVRSDRTLLARVIRNLVENAIRYTETGEVRIACDRVGTTVRIAVHDTGIGIPEEHLSRVWEEFHQVGNAERDRAQGFGLGLAIVRRITELLDHPIDVRSVPDAGSVFSIGVPAGRAAAVPRSMETATPTRGSGQLAVVVDDDPIVLLGLKTMLEEWGYEVVIAGSTDDALERLQRAGRPPHIIVADYRLREGRIGTEAILAIRRMFRTAIPGIILTGETGPECHRDAASYGLRVMHKPVTPRQLGRALDRQLEAAQ